MSEIQPLDLLYERHQAEQWQELKRLLGVDTKNGAPSKQGPAAYSFLLRSSSQPLTKLKRIKP